MTVLGAGVGIEHKRAGVRRIRGQGKADRPESRKTGEDSRSGRPPSPGQADTSATDDDGYHHDDRKERARREFGDDEQSRDEADAQPKKGTDPGCERLPARGGLDEENDQYQNTQLGENARELVVRKIPRGKAPRQERAHLREHEDEPPLRSFECVSQHRGDSREHRGAESG